LHPAFHHFASDGHSSLDIRLFTALQPPAKRLERDLEVVQLDRHPQCPRTEPLLIAVGAQPEARLQHHIES